MSSALSTALPPIKTSRSISDETSPSRELSESVLDKGRSVEQGKRFNRNMNGGSDWTLNGALSNKNFRKVEWSSDEELVDNKTRTTTTMTPPGLFLPPINYAVETSPSLQGRSPISQTLSPNPHRTGKLTGNRLLQLTDNPRHSMMLGSRRNGLGGLAKSEPILYPSPSSPLEVDQRSNDDSWPVDRKLLFSTTLDQRNDVTSGGTSVAPTDSGEPSYGGRLNITDYYKDKGSVVRLPNIYEQTVTRGKRRHSVNSNSNSNNRTTVINVASYKCDSS